MALATFGFEKNEEELRRLTDCTPFGVLALNIVEAARRLGLTAARKFTLTLEALKDVLDEGLFPIVYVDLGMLTGASGVKHSLVVLSISDIQVTVLDPAEGERGLPVEVFIAAWAGARYLTILVQR
jgi:ABC-type bacteriocin/lantibiotic exporter with double-glycine peptidase domain